MKLKVKTTYTSCGRKLTHVLLDKGMGIFQSVLCVENNTHSTKYLKFQAQAILNGQQSTLKTNNLNN